MTWLFLYQNCFFTSSQDETSRLSKFPGANSFHLDSSCLKNQSCLEELLKGKLTFHWIHPPHLSWRPKMEETLRLLLKKTCNVETRLELLSASGSWWWLSRKLANFKVLQPWNPMSSSAFFFNVVFHIEV